MGYRRRQENGLKLKKYRHRSIVIGESVYHIGGYTYYNDDAPKYVEKWTMTNTGFKKETKELIDDDGLDWNGFYFPEVFIVPADFCDFGKSRKL